MSPPLLEARSIALAYPQSAAAPSHRATMGGSTGPRVLDHIDLAVRQGELVSILGPSGSGKSSLLRILAGLLAASAGEVSVDGDRLDGPRPDVALAFQDPCLLPWLTVERNVAFGLGFRHQPRLTRTERRQRVDTALDEVGLSHARHALPAQLSGGMAQRAALARCLARKPRVLLLDEPFGALDEVTRGDMQRLLLNVVRDVDAATVLVTHDIDEALLVSDRVVLLGADGRQAGEWRIDLPQPREDRIEQLGALRIDILRTLRASVRQRAEAMREGDLARAHTRAHPNAHTGAQTDTHTRTNNDGATPALASLPDPTLASRD
jgi:NitT/TauT family transport system ATP-binding protein